MDGTPRKLQSPCGGLGVHPARRHVPPAHVLCAQKPTIGPSEVVRSDEDMNNVGVELDLALPWNWQRCAELEESLAMEPFTGGGRGGRGRGRGRGAAKPKPKANAGRGRGAGGAVGDDGMAEPDEVGGAAAAGRGGGGFGRGRGKGGAPSTASSSSSSSSSGSGSD